MVKAKIRDFGPEVDDEGRVVRHNCDDWRKGLGIKRLCKHVALFLVLPSVESRRILKDIVENKESWRFEITEV